MGNDDPTPFLPCRTRDSPPPRFRFLGFLRQPDRFTDDLLDLHEEDVLWVAAATFPSVEARSPPRTRRGRRRLPSGLSVAMAGEACGTSLPVNVPMWPGRGGGEAAWGAEERENEWEEDEEIVPPHVMVERRWSAARTFSVVEGEGRTLKGRDLRRVRNAVLRKTGFLD